MRILIATPLYPPDIAEPAPYAKELARRLSKNHTVTIATYGDFPEPIEGVAIRSISKRHPAILRLIRFVFLLWTESRKADVLYTQNGPSVEFPLYIVQWFSRTPFFIRMTDMRARASAKTRPLVQRMESTIMRTARMVITPPQIPDPLPRPEIFPLEQFPQKEMDAWEHSWVAHVDALVHTFSSYEK